MNNLKSYFYFVFLVLPCLLPPSTPLRTFTATTTSTTSVPGPCHGCCSSPLCTGCLVPHLTPLCVCHVHISHLTSGQRRIHLFLQARSNSHGVSSLFLCSAALQSTSSEATVPQTAEAKMSLLSAAESEQDHRYSPL